MTEDHTKLGFTDELDEAHDGELPTHLMTLVKTHDNELELRVNGGTYCYYTVHISNKLRNLILQEMKDAYTSYPDETAYGAKRCFNEPMKLLRTGKTCPPPKKFYKLSKKVEEELYGSEEVA